MNLEGIKDLNELKDWMIVNQANDRTLYVVGGLLVLGLIILLISKQIKIPSIVGYVVLGILLSFDIVTSIPFLSQSTKEWYMYTIENLNYFADLALAFIAFTIGTELSLKILKKFEKEIFWIVILQGIATFLLVIFAILALGYPLHIGLILGAIATATAPAPTVMLLEEYNAKGLLTSMIMVVVGVGEALALVIFSLVRPLAIVNYNGGSISLLNLFLFPFLEIGGSILLGLAVGYISQRYIVDLDSKATKTMTILATVVGTYAGAAYFTLSPLLANMAIGFAYRNFAKKNLGISEIMEVLTIPLYAVFFILAGVKMQIFAILSWEFIIIVVVYTLVRSIGKAGGAYLGGSIGRSEEKVKNYIGPALLFQSGVAIALAYTFRYDFGDAPEVALLIFNIILFTSILTEVFGPPISKWALEQVGEVE
ncbi:cation:proton antiporter [Halonatronum saccharophilum]|uniref:cation:proton antiporter n=2 Tax=Halonatronum saccharophilum TaxID=150060 RepID=UPI000482A9AE|nr:cation:proton antiporter [Halonatronum saccharophilum]